MQTWQRQKQAHREYEGKFSLQRRSGVLADDYVLLPTMYFLMTLIPLHCRARHNVSLCSAMAEVPAGLLKLLDQFLLIFLCHFLLWKACFTL